MTPGEDTEAFRANHLPWDDSDFYGLKLVLEDWAKKGFEGELNTTAAMAGYVTVTTKEWTGNRTAFVMFELHKLKGKKRMFWQGTHWASRMFTCQSRDGAFPAMFGCIGAPTLIYALQRSIDEAGSGMPSGSRLEQYYEQ